ncbi:hypothetical protein M419DRAFT_124867, partial [Trichoderma reesei RUT C-30]
LCPSNPQDFVYYQVLHGISSLATHSFGRLSIYPPPSRCACRWLSSSARCLGPPRHLSSSDRTTPAQIPPRLPPRPPELTTRRPLRRLLRPRRPRARRPRPRPAAAPARPTATPPSSRPRPSRARAARPSPAPAL